MNDRKCNSIYDLADITGVSYATVSRVLNNRGKTSEATRDLVLKAAAEHNFKPKMKARVQTIGIMIELDRMLKNGLYGYLDTVLMHLLNKLSIERYNVEFFSSHNISKLQDCLLDGLVCCGWNNHVSNAMKRMPNMPVVLMNSNSIEGCSRVYSDHVQGGSLAAEYLIKNGHQKAGIILDCRQWGNQQRADAFCTAFKNSGFDLEPVMVGFLNEQSEMILIRNMLKTGATAFFIAGEDFILRLNSTIQLLSETKEIAPTVISMENASISSYLNPPMTTISQPFEGMVNKIVEIIDSQIEKGINEPEEFKFENEIIVRNNDVLV